MLQKHGLLRSSPAHQRVHHHDLTVDASLAPKVETAGGAEEIAGVKVTRDGGVPELGRRNVEDQRGERIELVLAGRCSADRPADIAGEPFIPSSLLNRLRQEAVEQLVQQQSQSAEPIINPPVSTLQMALEAVSRQPMHAHNLFEVPSP